MYFIRLLLLAFLVCGCNSPFGGRVKVGVDPYWYPIDFGNQTAYVNGYTEELLLEMSRYSGVEFELIQANWDTLVDGLKEGKYDAILTSLPPYEYNLAKYEFSSNYLDLGPVLIVPINSTVKELGKMDRAMVGVITNDRAVLALQKHPSIIIRNYPDILALLNAVAAGEIQGALLEKIPAVNYVGDLYSEKLKVVGGVLSDTGIHFAMRKGANIRALNKTLESLRKKKTLEALQKKWDLTPPT